MNWCGGEDVFVTNETTAARAKELFPRGFVSIRPWFRLAPPPNLDIIDAAAEAMREGGEQRKSQRGEERPASKGGSRPTTGGGSRPASRGGIGSR